MTGSTAAVSYPFLQVISSSFFVYRWRLYRLLDYTTAYFIVRMCAISPCCGVVRPWHAIRCHNRQDWNAALFTLNHI